MEEQPEDHESAIVMKSIVECLSPLQIQITSKQISQTEKMVVGFETRGTHPLALNTQLLGVHPIAFLPSDRSALFSIFDLDESHIKQLAYQCSYLKGQNYKVAGDVFLIFGVWLIHLAMHQLKDEKTRHEFQMNVAKYLHYRYFGSIVNWNLKYGADEATMLAAVNSLSRKFDITNHGSWRATIEDRCLHLLSSGKNNIPKSVHYDTFLTAQPDKAFFYILTDIQSRLRDKINIVCEVYYTFHREGRKIVSSSATSTDDEGEKVLVERGRTLERIIAVMNVEVPNVNAFVHEPSLQAVVSNFPAVSVGLFREMLQYISLTASIQLSSGTYAKTEKIANQTVYVGIKALVETIIQVSYRYCTNNQINIANKYAMWNALRNMYTSSRVNDSYVLDIKNSVRILVDQADKTNREATKSSLRIAVIMYILYRSIQHQ